MCPLTGRISGRPAALETADMGRTDAGRQEDEVGAEAAAIRKLTRRTRADTSSTMSGTNRTALARQAWTSAPRRARLST